MHMFDENEKLKKYDNVVDIIDHYINVRKIVYVERKEYQLKILEHPSFPERPCREWPPGSALPF